MIGLGPGARSYTRSLHYAMDFAVSRASILRVLKSYVAKSDEAFGLIAHGVELDEDERMRRHVLKSILRTEGLDCGRFADLYRRNPLMTFPQLRALLEAGFLDSRDDRLTPTAAGLERSDAIGPWLYSPDIAARMEAFETT